MLPEKSQKVVDFEWPVVKGFIDYLLKHKENPEVILRKLKGLLDCKTLLVREKKALLNIAQGYTRENA